MTKIEITVSLLPDGRFDYQSRTTSKAGTTKKEIKLVKLVLRILAVCIKNLSDPKTFESSTIEFDK